MKENETLELNQSLEEMKTNYTNFSESYKKSLAILSDKEFTRKDGEIITDKIRSILISFENRLDEIGYVIMNMELNEFGDIQVGKEE